jgi:HEAT repeat protein
MKGRKALDVLCAVLVSDAHPEVRRTTAWALGEIQSKKAVPFLNQALSDPDQRVRAKVTWALSEILNQ